MCVCVFVCMQINSMYQIGFIISFISSNSIHQHCFSFTSLFFM